MTKLSIPLVITAALLCTVACESKEIEREAKDVEQASEKLQEKEKEVQEAKTELREKKAELAIEIQSELDEAEKRFKPLDDKATALTQTLDTTTGIGAEIKQAQMTAKSKLEAARNATSAEQTQQDLNDAKDAIDKLEKKLDEYNDKV